MKCAYHADQEAVFRCLRCQAPLCRPCAMEVAGRFYCPQCVAQLAAAAIALEETTPEMPSDSLPTGGSVPTEKPARQPAGSRRFRSRAPQPAEPEPEPPASESLPRSATEFVQLCDRQLAAWLSRSLSP